MLQATNVAKGKFVNLWVVFEAIRLHGPIPRARIAEATKLSKPAVSDLVDELFSLGLLLEEKSQERRIGKPPVPVSVNPDGAFSIGFHVDRGRVTAISQNLGGQVLCREHWQFDHVDLVQISRDLAKSTERLLQATPLDRDQFLGIGLATPGPFGLNVIAPPHLPGWDGGRLLTAMRALVPHRVLLANDGQCAITAESRFGETARGLSDFVYISLGEGLGSATMINGLAYGGAYGNAGEIGHTIVMPRGHRCVCGKRGCLETYVSVSSLRRFIHDHSGKTTSYKEIEALCQPGDPAVSDWLDAALEPLRSGLSTIENFFEPETMLFGGDAPAWIIDTLLEKVHPLYPSLRQTERALPRLMRADLGADAIARGAAVLPLLATFHPRYQEVGLPNSNSLGLFSKPV